MQDSKHVLINGAGLAGLALAIALAKRNIRSTLFELRDSPTTIGGGIALAPNALRVLDKTIGVADIVRQRGYEYETIQIMADDGKQIGKARNGGVKDYGYPALRIPRVEIHGALVDCAKEYPELITIQWDASIDQIMENEDGVKVTLRDGSTMEGDIVVGADGIHSKVREFVLGDQAPTPEFSGLFGVGGLVNRADVELGGCDPPAFIYSQKGTLLIFPSDHSGTKLGWSIQYSMPEKTREGWHEYITSGDALKDARELYKDGRQPAKAILENTTQDSIRGWPPYSIPDLPTWHTRRVVLVGDAAHAIPPSAGQGSAQAFEDVGLLARLLSEPEALKNGYEPLFAHFERVRKARFETIRTATKMSSKTRATDMGRLGWMVKKYVMMAALWWMGGEVGSGEIYNYDVNDVPLVPTSQGKK